MFGQHSARLMLHRSVGITPPLRRGIDLAQPGAIEHVAASRSHRGEIILFTSDACELC